MKTFLGLCVVGLWAASHAGNASGAIIANWTFETTPPTSATGVVADSGAFAASSFASTNSGGSITNPVGNGSAESYSSTNWSQGEYFQFSTSTEGFSSITVSYAQAASDAGPGHFNFQYSFDGTNFVQFGPSYIGPTADFDAGAVKPGNILTYDLSPVTFLNDSPVAAFRIALASNAPESGQLMSPQGTFRVDDFTVNGIAAVPEPSSMAALAAVAIGGLFARRRRKAAKE